MLEYVWGLEPEDFAMCMDEEQVDELGVYTEEELNTEELNSKIVEQIKYKEDFNIPDWSEWVQEHLDHFKPETLKLLATLFKRNGYED